MRSNYGEILTVLIECERTKTSSSSVTCQVKILSHPILLPYIFKKKSDKYALIDIDVVFIRKCDKYYKMDEKFDGHLSIQIYLIKDKLGDEANKKLLQYCFSWLEQVTRKGDFHHYVTE